MEELYETFFHNIQTHPTYTHFYVCSKTFSREHLLPHSIFLALYQVAVIEHTISFQRTIMYENLRT